MKRHEVLQYTKKPSEKDYNAILKEKDREISDLKLKLSAHISRSSNLENRLISTLDALDIAQANADAELQRETELNTSLRNKLAAYHDIVRSTEAEKDDLKDAVLKLIQRVETSNDYSKWPHSRIYIPTPIDILPDDGKLLGDSHPADQSNSYAAALIKHLSLQLAQEQKAYATLKSESQARVISLEAQVARRDAEIEDLIHDLPNLRPPDPSSPGEMHSNSVISHKNTHSNKTSSKISQEEAIEILEMTTVRNRRLEAEIRSISNQLEQAKSLAAGQLAGPSTHIVNSMDRSFQSTHSTPTGSTGVHHPSRSLAEEEKVEQATHLALDSLRDEVAELSRGVDALASERDKLRDQTREINPPPRNRSQKMKDDFDHILLLEDECVRLSKRENALLGELERMRNTAQKRENTLLQQIEWLKSKYEVHEEYPDEDNTQRYSPNIRSSLSTFPPLIPIPESPQMNHIPEMIPLPFSMPTSPDPTFEDAQISIQPQLAVALARPRDITQIESELEGARREVSDTGRAIDDLRASIIRFREHERRAQSSGNALVDDAYNPSETSFFT